MTKRLVTPDKITHYTYNPDEEGLVLLCEYADARIEYDEMRRFTSVVFDEATPVTCLGCLAEYDDYVVRLLRHEATRKSR